MKEFFYLLLLLLVVAVFFQVDFVFYIVYLCVGLYAVSRLLTPYVFRRVTVRRRYNKRAFLGEEVPLNVEVHNPTRLPLLWLTLREGLPLALRHVEELSVATALGGRETASFPYTLRANRRGYYQIGPLRVTSGDVFGFAEEQGLVPVDYITVYPRIVPITRLGLPSRLPFGTLASHQRLYEDPARPMGVRAYQSGDTLRRINWKVSAHTRDLLVKTFQPAISLESTILLNLHRPDFGLRTWLDSAEWAITVAASVAAHLVAQRQAVGLITNGLDPLAGADPPAFDAKSGRILLDRNRPERHVPTPIPPRAGRANLMKVLETLARLESETTLPLVPFATRASVNLSWGVTLILVTPRGDEATCQMLHRFVRAGLNPILLVIEPTANFAAVRARARSLGFQAYLVLQPEDLEIRPPRVPGL